MVSLVWLITGTSSGFGAEFVKSILARGDKVIATARNLSKIKHLESLGAAILEIDVSDTQDELDRKAKEAIQIYGTVDVLVNNAGYAHFGVMEEVRQEDWNRQFATNVWGTMNTTRAFLPHFREKKGGTIVFMGSIAAWSGSPTVGLYCSSKGALRLYVDALRSELQPTGVKALLVEPGYFRTDFLAGPNPVFVQPEIEAYQTVASQMSGALQGMNGKQPGDPVKGVETIIDVVKQEGVAHGRSIPNTLALGGDAVAYIREKCEEQLRILADWEEVSSRTAI